MLALDRSHLALLIGIIKGHNLLAVYLRRIYLYSSVVDTDDDVNVQAYAKPKRRPSGNFYFFIFKGLPNYQLESLFWCNSSCGWCFPVGLKPVHPEHTTHYTIGTLNRGILLQ